MDVINSFVIGLNYFQQWIPPDPWHRFIYTHVPELRLDYHPLDRAALYYVRWNQMIETRAAGNPYFFCQLETVPSKLLAYLGRHATTRACWPAQGQQPHGRQAGVHFRGHPVRPDSPGATRHE